MARSEIKDRPYYKLLSNFSFSIKNENHSAEDIRRKVHPAYRSLVSPIPFDSPIPQSLDRKLMNILRSARLLLLFPLLFTSCRKSEDTEAEALKQFRVKGVVMKIQDEGRTLIIDHEEMPGYMGAMTMPFRVKQVDDSAKLTPGDEILFTYKVAELSSWIEGIERTGKREVLPASPPKSVPSSKLLKIGEAFPDFDLLDENGAAVQLSDYRGEVVALTFIFTRCPVPDYCPAMMRNFKVVEKLMEADESRLKNYKLLTVSFDSEFDTPEVMKTYGQQFGHDSNNWNLLSSPNQDQVRSIGESVGLMFGKSNDAIYSHNLRTVVLDREGKITKIFTDENWNPEDLVEEIKNAAIE